MFNVARQRRLNVLTASTCQTDGGAGRSAEMLSAYLRDAGHHVQAFVARNPAQDPHCHVVGHWRTAGLARRLRRWGFPEVGELTSLLWQARPEYATADVLHLNNIHGEYVSLAALPVWGWQKPVVWTLHDLWSLTGNCAVPRDCDRWRRGCGQCPRIGTYPMAPVDRSRFYRGLKPAVIRRLRPRLVTPSQWLADRVREVVGLRRLPLRVIRYPIDCELFRPREDRAALRRQFGLAPDRPTVIMSGFSWADRFKGPDKAAAALRMAHERVPGLQLLIIGMQSDVVLAQAGVAGRALPFLEGREPLADAYAAADVCLFPSRAENYPLTILESLACETPVVAFDVGGVPEQIDHMQSGYVARDGNAEELTAGLVAILGTAGRARGMGRLGREFVLRTSAVSVVAAQYEQEYRRALVAWCHRRKQDSPRFVRGPLALRVARALGWPATAVERTAVCRDEAAVSTVAGGRR